MYINCLINISFIFLLRVKVCLKCCLICKDNCSVFLGVNTSGACSQSIFSTYAVIFFRLCVPVDSVLRPDHTFPQLWEWNPVHGESAHLIYVVSVFSQADDYWQYFMHGSCWHNYIFCIFYRLANWRTTWMKPSTFFSDMPVDKEDQVWLKCTVCCHLAWVYLQVSTVQHLDWPAAS